MRGPRVPTLQTARLLLRPWRGEDRAEFAALNADAEVMAHFPAPLDRRQSDALVDYIEATFAASGFGLWAVEVPGGVPFIGFVGLNPVPFEACFTPAVEVGWRLARRYWGRGYATEAAKAAVEYGFGEAGLEEIVSFATRENRRSRAVMERLGMTHDPADDFDHPNLAADDPFRPHVLYRIPMSCDAGRRRSG
ncbi:MAG: GNAT family N-acetyltransferase [Actinomycetota bacterium]|nr:GNAT family N-acetyltransferase [Actinomycetota bacterium]